MISVVKSCIFFAHLLCGLKIFNIILVVILNIMHMMLITIIVITATTTTVIIIIIIIIVIVVIVIIIIILLLFNFTYHILMCIPKLILFSVRRRENLLGVIVYCGMVTASDSVCTDPIHL